MALSQLHTFVFSCLPQGFWVTVWVLLIIKALKERGWVLKYTSVSEVTCICMVICTAYIVRPHHPYNIVRPHHPYNIVRPHHPYNIVRPHHPYIQTVESLRTCTLCYVAVLNRNWILHFKCITDFDALQWALIACTNIWCILHVCALPLAKQRIELCTGLNIWRSIIWGCYTCMYMYITASFPGSSPAIHTVQKKQC